LELSKKEIPVLAAIELLSLQAELETQCIDSLGRAEQTIASPLHACSSQLVFMMFVMVFASPRQSCSCIASEFGR
jgi:hypothetical protein